ncbi:MAG: hypothetical protein JXA89_01075 [Anaerolineae bacterium]|nr:hypothetical protein [Anaerolineae bacterium]
MIDCRLIQVAFPLQPGMMTESVDLDAIRRGARRAGVQEQLEEIIRAARQELKE